MSFIDELKYSFKGRNNFNLLIYLNLIIFGIIQIVKIVLFFKGSENSTPSLACVSGVLCNLQNIRGL